jgi:hypothetical protein
MITGQNYEEDGYVLMRDLLPPDSFEALETRCLDIIHERTEQRFSALDSRELQEFICSNRDVETHLYGEIRQHPEAREIAMRPEIKAVIDGLLRTDQSEVFEKIPFRIDCPFIVRELAVWHQDYFYVKGTPDTITAWIPVCDVSYKEGCLLVMPGSHKLGAVAHDEPLLGKKFYPKTIFEQPVRYVEMKRGDVLFFHGYLLHSSGLNLSETIRYSLQPRYLRAGDPSDPAMGQRYPLT